MMPNWNTIHHSAPAVATLQDGAVAFRWKDYRIKGRDRQKTMTLAVPEMNMKF